MNEVMSSKIVARLFSFNDVADKMRFEQNRLRNEIELISCLKGMCFNVVSNNMSFERRESYVS